jgi:hypothetical protein
MDAPPGSASASRVWRPACIDVVVNEAGACWAGRFPRDPRWPGRCCARDATPISALITLAALIVKVGPRRSAWCAGRYPTADRVTRGSAPMHPGTALTTQPQSRGSWFLPQPLVSAAENWAALRTSCHSCPHGSVSSELPFCGCLPCFRASELPRGAPRRRCFEVADLVPGRFKKWTADCPSQFHILRTGGDAVFGRSDPWWMSLAPDPTGAFHDEPSIREHCRRGAAGRGGRCAQRGAARAPEACSCGRARGAGEHRGAGHPGGAPPGGAAARGARRCREVQGRGWGADPSGSCAGEPCRRGASTANEEAGELAPRPREERLGSDR